MTLAGYEYTERVLSTWDWPAAAAAYKERAENEAHNVRVWRGRYENLLKQVKETA